MGRAMIMLSPVHRDMHLRSGCLTGTLAFCPLQALRTLGVKNLGMLVLLSTMQRFLWAWGWLALPLPWDRPHNSAQGTAGFPGFRFQGVGLSRSQVLLRAAAGWPASNSHLGSRVQGLGGLHSLFLAGAIRSWGLSQASGREARLSCCKSEV